MADIESRHSASNFDGTISITGDLTLVSPAEIRGSICYLTFGSNATMATSDQYLKAIDGITTSSTIGYRMIRAGSITGISIQTNVTFFIDPGNIAFEVRKAGSNVFSTSLAVSSGGIKGTQSTQARGVDTFTAGQIISVYANFDPSVIATLDNTIVIVEIITD